MERLTEKRDGVNVIPLRNAVLGVDLPHWRLVHTAATDKFLSGDAADRLAAYENTGLEPKEIKYRLDAVTAAVDAALSVVNEFAPEMEYCIYSRIYQAVETIGEEANHG